MGSNWFLEAGWEKREGRSICRYMVVWKQEIKNEWAGAVVGYSGGGSFEAEMFYATFQNNELVSLMIDLEDKITGNEIDFYDDVPDEMSTIAAEAMEVVWKWNDSDEWEDSDQIILIDNRIGELTREGDMFYLKSEFPEIVNKICELAGLTSGPR